MHELPTPKPLPADTPSSRLVPSAPFFPSLPSFSGPNHIFFSNDNRAVKSFYPLTFSSTKSYAAFRRKSQLATIGQKLAGAPAPGGGGGSSSSNTPAALRVPLGIS